MTALSAWFATRSRREQWLLAIMVALVALVLIWLAVIRPVGDALSSERARHEDAVIRLGTTSAQVAAIRDADRHRPPPVTGGLADTVRTRAGEAGFTLASLEADGPDRVRIAIASARPAALVPWLARLENAGVLVDTASFTDNRDRTVAARLTLKARAS